MPGKIKGNQPLPQSITFLTCMGIMEHRYTHTTQLMNPISHFPVTDFPTNVPISLFVETAGGHGSYDAQLCLLNMSEEVVWQTGFPAPIQINDPIIPAQFSFLDLILSIPRPDRYRFVMLLNGQEFVQRGLWFGPSGLFKQR